MKIEITTEHPASHYGIPVCVIDGNPVDDRTGIIECCKALKWSRAKLAEMTGKAPGGIDNYRNGRAPVPAEAWNVLRDALRVNTR